MPGFETERILDSIASSIGRLSESIKVIGDPIEAGEKVIIPAVVAHVGFGGGGGSGTSPNKQQEGAGEGSGGGGGGGLTLAPVFLVVDSQGERLLTVPGLRDSVMSAVDVIKDIFKGGRAPQDKHNSDAADSGPPPEP